MGSLRSASHPEFRGKKILVVSDREITRHLFERALKSKGLDVVSTRSPLDAVELASGSGFSLFIIDVNSSEAEVIDLSQKLRRGGQEGKCIIISEQPSLHFLITAKELGLTSILVRPFDLDEFDNAVLSALCA